MRGKIEYLTNNVIASGKRIRVQFCIGSATLFVCSGKVPLLYKPIQNPGISSTKQYCMIYNGYGRLNESGISMLIST